MNNLIDITKYGFTEQLKKAALIYEQMEPARILAQEKGFYRIITEKGERLAEVSSAAFGVDILVTTSIEENGYKELLPFISADKTTAFIGSSGVGKSTLINRLLGKEYLKTNGLRNDDKGRHTTTRRELFLLPSGGMVIDTLGMREFGMWDNDTGIEKTFLIKKMPVKR